MAAIPPFQYRVAHRTGLSWTDYGYCRENTLGEMVAWLARCYPGRELKVTDLATNQALILPAEEMAGIAEVMRVAKINILSPLDRAEQPA